MKTQGNLVDAVIVPLEFGFEFFHESSQRLIPLLSTPFGEFGQRLLQFIP
jgi:hypothetical protein